MKNVKEIIEDVLNDFFETNDIFSNDEAFGERTIVVDIEDSKLLAEAITDVLETRRLLK